MSRRLITLDEEKDNSIISLQNLNPKELAKYIKDLYYIDCYLKAIVENTKIEYRWCGNKKLTVDKETFKSIEKFDNEISKQLESCLENFSIIYERFEKKYDKMLQLARELKN